MNRIIKVLTGRESHLYDIVKCEGDIVIGTIGKYNAKTDRVHMKIGVQPTELKEILLKLKPEIMDGLQS